MRRKKHKHTRRAVNFYKINFGFHEPFKVRACLASVPCLQALPWSVCVSVSTAVRVDSPVTPAFGMGSPAATASPPPPLFRSS